MVIQRCRQIVRCLAVVAMALVAAPASAEGMPSDAGDPCPVTEADCPADLDIWVVSTRHLPGICALPEAVDLRVERLVGSDCGRRWEPAELAELVGEPQKPLVVFAHGNRYTAADAKTQGLSLARRLSAHACGGATRVVIFSWPSAQQGILLKDARRKFDRAYADGHYLAWFLAQLAPEQPVAIVGYSLGALVATRAFEDLASVSPSGIPWSERPGRTNLVFVTPAIRCDAFAPSGPFRNALGGLDRFTLLINSRDEALKFFPKVEPNVRADAMGYVGVSRRWLPEALEYSATDTAAAIGKMHTMWRYLESRSLSDRIANGAVAGLTN
jgi:esterase/lipase superfamily enzyme